MSGQDPPRNPRDMQGLLKFCSEYTAREDPTNGPSLEAMDPQRRQWLEEALNNMVENTPRRLATAMNHLASDSVTMPGDDISAQEEALDVLEEYLEDIDHANDIVRLNGLPVILSVLESPHTSLRLGTCAVLGNICQNNQTAQMALLNLNAMPVLLSIVDKDSSDGVRSKAVYAVSCLVRGCEEGEKKFMEHDGFSSLVKASQTDFEQLTVKVTFLLCSLARSKPSHVETLVEMGYVDQLCSQLSSTDSSDILREHCTSALLTLASTHRQALLRAAHPSIGLEQTLNDRIKVIEGNNQFMEEEEYAKNLLNMLTSDDGEEDAAR